MHCVLGTFYIYDARYVKWLQIYAHFYANTKFVPVTDTRENGELSKKSVFFFIFGSLGWIVDDAIVLINSIDEWV